MLALNLTARYIPITMKTNFLSYKAYINDTEENCWQVLCLLSGERPVYDNLGSGTTWVVEGFKISELTFESIAGPSLGAKHFFSSLAQVPDAFKQRDLNEFEEDALRFFIDDWIDCQNKAADMDMDFQIQAAVENNNN